MNLTVALCTKNRIKDLTNCLISISKQQNISKKDIEILIIDDGEIDKKKQKELQSICEGYDFSYFKKTSPGLFRSRLEAIKRAKSDKILFLDDDVKIDKNYIKILLDTYAKFPNAAGVGGVDMLLPDYSFFRKLYSILFLYHSNDKSKLSLSMMNSSMYLWKNQKEPFVSQYLDGCNMSFRKEALKGAKFQDYFNSYSLGEDIYFSLIASQKGDLIVNPALKVKHFKSPLSRDRVENVAFMKVVNHYKLLSLSKRGNYKYLTILWTYIGYILASLLKGDFEEIKGYLKGIKYLAKKI